MSKWKVLLITLVCVGGVSLSFAVGIIPIGAASEAGVTAGNEDLVREIQALRDEIKQLRQEIGNLRMEITALAQALQQRPPIPESGKKQEGLDQPLTPPPPGIRIEFTQVPPRGAGPDSQGNIGGRVLGVEAPQKYKIVLYVLTDKWYVQPLAIDALTTIKGDGTWSNWTHLGNRYAALVVRPSFQPNAYVQALPPVGGDIVATAEVPAQ